MDSYVLKLSGKAELETPLANGHNIRTLLEGSIVEETISDNDDGTSTHYYKFKPVNVELIKETGERLRARDTRSRSQQLRALLYKKWREANVPKTFEDYYDRAMIDIMDRESGRSD